MTAPKDHILMRTIRRAQLDAFWATEPSTLSRNLGELRKGAIIANTLGFQQKLFRPMGPFPLEDTFGMGPAIVMLQLSLRQEVNDRNVQFSMIRKFCSTYYHCLDLPW
jgi:hypothetical protein